MQISDMRVLRSFHLCRALHNQSLRRPNPSLACCSSSSYPQFPKGLHSTPSRRFLSSAAANEFSASDSSDSPTPGDSNSQRAPSVETFYDPMTGRLVAKRGKGSEPDAGRDENASYAQVGTRVYGEVVGNSGAGISSRQLGKTKTKTVFVCQSCGHSDGQWWGICRQCKQVGSMRITESVGRKVNVVRASGGVPKSWFANEIETAARAPVRSTDVTAQIDKLNWRIPLPGPFGAEVERVLGGGIVPGSLILVGGDPGVGKSTLLLQVAALVAAGSVGDAPSPVIYVSGEESVEQIGNRVDRLSIESEHLFLLASTDIEAILHEAKRLSPSALIVDSIQTVYLPGTSGSAGGVQQVKECTSALLRYAKSSGIPVLLIGHVTKSGDIAGPRVLEHIVDVVLHMEGDKCSSHRLLRPVKNRFGSTDELGVFRMTKTGLEEVSNPSEMFLSEHNPDSDYLAGLAVTVMMDGSRAFLIEIQALCVAGTKGDKHANGISISRADMLISVITKQAGLKLQENGVYLNVVSGVNLNETAGDLAIAAAICSSFLESPIPNGVAFIAEVGLGGELRTDISWGDESESDVKTSLDPHKKSKVPQMDKRINTLAKLGYKRCIVPKNAESLSEQLQLEGMQIVCCNNLKEMIYTVFTPGTKSSKLIS